jgi:CubicO group peptidase (beta-lactamase class C family)
VSKTVVAVALMKAIELKYFTLDTDINEILPFKIVNPHQPEEIIRVRHLTTHTSGIIDNEAIYNRSYRFMKSPDTDSAFNKLLRSRGYTADLADTTLSAFLTAYLSVTGSLYSDNNFYNSKPGQRSGYSNIASALAAYLVEVKAGMSFARFTQKFLFGPLKMRHADWFFTGRNLKEQAVPYFDKLTALPYYSLTTYPDGGLRTSALDLSKYVAEMMRALNNDGSILDQQFYDTMFRPTFTQANLPANMSLQTRNKGVFWNLYGDGFIGHDGDDPGASANILFNKDVGVVFISNIYIDDRSEVLNILKTFAHKVQRSANR